MLYKTLRKEAFRSVVEAILAGSESVGPRRVGTDRHKKPIHQFLPVERFEDIDFSYDTTEFSAKTYFLPFREKLSTYRFSDGDWEQEIRYRAEPRALIGLHACDINALLRLDKVFARDWYPSPYYLSRRRNTFILGIDHDPCEGAFCRSLGTDTVTHGFDLFLTDIGESYFAAVGSDRGLSLIDRFGAQPITDEDSHRYVAERKRIAALMENGLNLNNLPNLLDIEFKSPIWEKWGAKCLSCGTCAMVCPTCYCHGVYERISMDFQEGAKIRQLHACTLVDFAVVAGGHNFRPTPESRLKYRYYHQHRGFVEQHEEPKCVGCNRCGRACLAGIAPVDVIRELQEEVGP
ncbi:MAG: 4Fe-4S dicluster domain-containing protein [Acidobacteriota bacterium]